MCHLDNWISGSGDVLRVNIGVAIALVLPDDPTAPGIRILGAAREIGHDLVGAGKSADLRQAHREIGVAQSVA